MAKKVRSAQKKRPSARGMILVRNVGMTTWTEFKDLATQHGKKLGPFLEELMREKLDRDKE
jgi:hypothetical protein